MESWNIMFDFSYNISKKLSWLILKKATNGRIFSMLMQSKKQRFEFSDWTIRGWDTRGQYNLCNPTLPLQWLSFRMAMAWSYEMGSVLLRYLPALIHITSHHPPQKLSTRAICIRIKLKRYQSLRGLVYLRWYLG